MRYIYSGKSYTPKEIIKNQEININLPKIKKQKLIFPGIIRKKQKLILTIIIRKKQSKLEKCKKHRELALKYYYENKSKMLVKIKNWKLKNPEKEKKYRKKYFSKWYAKKRNKTWMKKYMREYYFKNSKKQISRNITYKIKNMITPECKNCGIKENLQIHHEIYPIVVQEVIDAIKSNQIYYLCKPCHKKIK